MKNSTRKISSLVFALVGLSLTACSDDNVSFSGTEALDTLSSLEQYVIQVVNASSEECPAGGKTYIVFVDGNKNGNFDESEEAVSTQTVCNGTNGANGYSTLFSIDRIATESCTSGTGVQINSGLDLSRNLVLENSEIGQSQVLCDGANGQNGETGANGKDGKALVFQVTAAPGNICPAGGKIILMASDENDDGLFDIEDSNKQSLTLCNGTNGADGEDGEDGDDAVLPAYTPVAPIFPCGNTVTFKEVLLRLQNGHVLASFSDNAQGLMTRLSLIPDGSYVDTDNTNCTFNLSTSGRVRSVSWFGQVQQSWNITY